MEYECSHHTLFTLFCIAGDVEVWLGSIASKMNLPIESCNGVTIDGCVLDGVENTDESGVKNDVEGVPEGRERGDSHPGSTGESVMFGRCGVDGDCSSRSRLVPMEIFCGWTCSKCSTRIHSATFTCWAVESISLQ